MSKRKNDQQPGNERGSGAEKFPGFDKPEQNYFKMPNDWTNLTADIRSLAELKVVEYVLRHTWGYHEYGVLKRITLDEFQHGRKKTDRTRIDKGIGMGKQAVISGIKQAVRDGFLVEEKDETDKGRVKKYYGLRMLSREDEEEGYENHTPGVLTSYPRDMKVTHRSEKDTSERHLKKTVNSGIALLKRMPDLNQPKGRTEYVADHILEEMGDKHSEKFYRLVAAKIPEEAVRRMTSEVRADGADNPAKVFTYKVKQWAVEQQRKKLAFELGG